MRTCGARSGASAQGHLCLWSKSRDAIREYVDEQEAKHRKALKLDELVKMAENEI